MGTREMEEEVGQTNKKRKAGNWILVQKLKSRQEDIKGGWTKALENCATGRMNWSARGSVVIRMRGLKARNSWGREGEVQMETDKDEAR